MIDLERVDQKVQGWGLQPDDVEITKILEHLLWDCMSPCEFRQRCEFIFDDSKILLTWREQKRSVTIRLSGKREIEASV